MPCPLAVCSTPVIRPRRSVASFLADRREVYAQIERERIVECYGLAGRSRVHRIKDGLLRSSDLDRSISSALGKSSGLAAIPGVCGRDVELIYQALLHFTSYPPDTYQWASRSCPMVPINRGRTVVPVRYKQQHRCHRQAQKNSELFAFGAGAVRTRVHACPRADCGAHPS